MKNKNKTLLTLFAFLLFLPLITFAGTKNLGETCEANADCVANTCATSSLTGAGNKFCVCATPTDCENKYKKESADETWTCEVGAAKSKDLPFCNSTKRGIQDPIASTSTPSTPEATAAATDATTYDTIPPVPIIKIPGLPEWESETVTAEDEVSFPYIAEYIIALYKYGLVIGSFLAVVMIMIGGIMYLTAAGASNLIGTAKNLILGAISGLILLLGSYLLLMTINPNLVNLTDLSLDTVKPEFVSLPEDHADTEPTTDTGTPGQKPQALTKDKAALLAICNKPKSEWPKSTPGMIDGTNVTRGFSAPGIKSKDKNLPVDNSILPALTALGKAALAAPGGPYEIVIRDGYRTLAGQLNIACGHKNDNFANIGNAYAWPGSSLHGIGRAVDILLRKNGTDLTTLSFSGQFDARWAAGTQTLAQIAYAAGFKRYTKEIWHFEYQSGISGCRTNTCTKASHDCSCN